MPSRNSSTRASPIAPESLSTARATGAMQHWQVQWSHRICIALLFSGRRLRSGRNAQLGAQRGWRRFGIYVYWMKSIGDPKSDAALVRAASPRLRVAEIRIPVLLVHGEEDNVVPIQQRASCRGRSGKPASKSTMTTYKMEGHGGWSDENEFRTSTRSSRLSAGTWRYRRGHTSTCHPPATSESLLRDLGCAERHENLVEHHIIQHQTAPRRPHPPSETPRVIAGRAPIISARPRVPSERRAAHMLTPRARRERSGVERCGIACIAFDQIRSAAGHRGIQVPVSRTKAMPLSYGTFSDSRASVASESA